MNYFYLLRLKLFGIKNIEKPLVFDFYKKTINNNFNPDKYKIKAIYGENGSGKTAIITSVKILKSLIINKDYLFDSDNQKSLLEIINKKTDSSYIEVEFYSVLNKCIFKYCISLKKSENARISIDSEKLEVKNGNYSKNQYKNIYSVRNGSLDEFDVNKTFFNENRTSTLNLLNQQTFVSNFVSRFDFNDNNREYQESVNLLFYIFGFGSALNVCLDNPDEQIHFSQNQKVMDNIINSRFLISNDRFIPKQYYSEFEKQVKRMLAFIRIFKTDLINISIDAKDYKDDYKCNLVMNYRDYSIDEEFESSGIRKLMNLFYYLDFAALGGIVFIDELDSNINNIYLDKIIEFFMLYGKGQLCFTAHNLSPMGILKNNKNSIDFISSINTVHTWANNGNQSPENTYRNGFIEDSPFNVDSSDFLGILGGSDE